MDQAKLQRLQAALFAAHEAGDTAAAGALAAEIVRSKGVTVPAALSAAEQVSVDPISRGAREFAKDMSVPQQVTAGAGKAVADTGLGFRQITGNASQAEVDETKRLDRPLMDTTGGMVGNIGTQVGTALLPGGLAARAPGAVGAAGKLMLSAPATAGGVATQTALGAAQAGLQPTATGESRAANMIIGGAAGGAIPAAGMGLKGVKSAVEPLYAGGREQILARALRGAAGENANDVIAKLENARNLVPGSQRTAAEVAESGGFAALQRAASAVDPESYAARGLQQNEARVGALRDMAGAGGRREAITAIRDEGADEMYAAARALGVDQGMAKALKPQVSNLMERMPSGVMERAKELARLNGETLGNEGSVNGLHWMKLAVDDMLSSGKQTGIGSQMTWGLTQFKDDLLSVIDELSPAYGQARQSFAEMSQLPNQMAVAQEIAEKSINPLTDVMQPQAFARALNDNTAARATGFGGSTLKNTMEPEKLAMLQALKGDLAGTVAARDLGRGAGSDTVQKLAMTNLMEQSGIPAGVLNLPGIGRVGNFLYKNADESMQQTLAKALMDPRETARIMKLGPSPTAETILRALRVGGSPLAIGSTSSMLNAQ